MRRMKREADFDSLVAFDFETTGKYPGTNAIIEVGEWLVMHSLMEFHLILMIKRSKKAVNILKKSALI